MKNLSYLSLISVALLTGCAGNDTSLSYQVEEQSEEYAAIAKNIKDAENRIRKGESMIENGKSDVKKGRKLIKKGTDSQEDGYKLVERGQRELERASIEYKVKERVLGY